MADYTNISLSRGAPSLDIIAVDGLRASAARAFEHDPAGTVTVLALSVIARSLTATRKSS